MRKFAETLPEEIKTVTVSDELPEELPEELPAAEELAGEVITYGVEELVGMSAQTKQAAPVGKSRHQRIVDAVGEDAKAIKRPPTDAVAAIKDGVLVTLTVAWWKGTAKLEGTELALNVDPKMKEFANSRLKLGNKRLIDNVLIQELHNAERLARNALYDNSIKTTYGWFVPTDRYGAFKAGFLKARAIFNENLDLLCDQLPQVRAAIYSDFLPLAHTAWQERRLKWTEKGCAEGLFANDPEPTELFLAEFLGDIAGMIPDPLALRERATFEYSLSVLSAPDTDLAAMYATENSEVNADLQKHLQKQKAEYIDKFVISIAENLVDGVKRLAEDVTKTLGKKAVVHGNTLGKVLNVINNLRNMNLLGNQDVEEQLSKLETFIELKRGVGKVSSADLQTELAVFNQKIMKINEDIVAEIEATNPSITGFTLN